MENQVGWHGTPMSDEDFAIKPKQSWRNDMEKIATREAYGKALPPLPKKNDKIVVLDADLSKSTKTNIFAKEFPDRFSIWELQKVIWLPLPQVLPLAGKPYFSVVLRVFAAGRAFEIVRNSICYPKLNVKIAATHAGITVGEDGGSIKALRISQSCEVLPNMEFFVPADGVETAKIVSLFG